MGLRLFSSLSLYGCTTELIVGIRAQMKMGLRR